VSVAIDILLGFAVLCVWLGAIGFLRFAAPLDRLHCAAFVNIAAGAAVTAAVWLQDGPSDRALKTLLVLAAVLVCGAATVHAVGRALVLRTNASQ